MYTRHVTFGFYRGARLKDPKGLLEGIGKELRHVKIRRKRDIQVRLFSDWVKKAVALNEGQK